MKPVDRQNVFEICERLNAAGARPTLARVREGLGGGSFTTIQPLLQEWKKQRAVEKPAAAPELPSALRAMIDGLAIKVWEEAAREAGEELRLLREGMQSRLDEAEAERAEAADEIKRLETELQSARAETVSASTMADSLRQQLGSANTQIQLNIQRLTDLEKVEQEYRQLLSVNGELRGQIKAEIERRRDAEERAARNSGGKK